MYKANHSGSAYTKNGIRYAWNAGDEEIDAPKGSLDHVEGLTWSAGKKTKSDSDKPLSGTKAEIQAWLDDKEIDYPEDALKDELIDILKDA